MIRECILVLFISSVVCFVCVLNADYLKSLYRELLNPNARTVEIVDEKSTLGMFKESYWEEWETFIICLTACVISVWIGWNANNVRKALKEPEDEHVLNECVKISYVSLDFIDKLEKRLSKIEKLLLSSDDETSVQYGTCTNDCNESENSRLENELELVVKGETKKEKDEINTLVGCQTMQGDCGITTGNVGEIFDTYGANIVKVQDKALLDTERPPNNSQIKTCNTSLIDNETCEERVFIVPIDSGLADILTSETSNLNNKLITKTSLTCSLETAEDNSKGNAITTQKWNKKTEAEPTEVQEELSPRFDDPGDGLNMSVQSSDWVSERESEDSKLDEDDHNIVVIDMITPRPDSAKGDSEQKLNMHEDLGELSRQISHQRRMSQYKNTNKDTKHDVKSKSNDDKISTEGLYSIESTYESSPTKIPRSQKSSPQRKPRSSTANTELNEPATRGPRKRRSRTYVAPAEGCDNMKKKFHSK